MSDSISKRIDSRGKACPGPISDLAIAYRRSKVGDVLELLATDPGVKSDVQAWARKTGNEVVSMDQQGDTITSVLRIVKEVTVSATRKKVVILGGGSGATILANTLDRRRFEITVVSKSREHLFQPALLYLALANGRSNIARDQRRLLSRHVELRRQTVSKVDLREHNVLTTDGDRIQYDALVVATGARPETSQIPGLTEVAERFGNYHSGIAPAQKLWAALDAFRGGTIVLGQAHPICVCPPSPVEGILLVDRLLRERGLRAKSRLVYFTPYPRPYPAAPISEIVEPLMHERGIEVMTFFDIDRIDPATRTIFSIEGDHIEYDLPVIVPPFVGADIAYEPAAVQNEDRFLLADKATLRIQGFSDAYAIGDAADLPTSKAGVGAHLAAGIVARELHGEPAVFDGRTHCPMDLGDGTGTFVISSYTSPAIKYKPTRIKHLMKVMMGRFYWMSLSGLFEPFFRAYFAITAPERLAKRAVSARPVRDWLALPVALVAVIALAVGLTTQSFAATVEVSTAVAVVYYLALACVRLLRRPPHRTEHPAAGK